MGDRGQVHIHDEFNSVYLYTHSGAEHLIRDVRDGMAAGRDRWNDLPYLTRILFDYMRDISDFRGTLGFGISCMSAYNAWREVDIDMDRQVITIYNYNEDVKERWMGSFEKFMTINWRK